MPTSDQNRIEKLVYEEIGKAHAPVSGYFVACALVTDRGIYINHNYEHNDPVLFEHAEDRAVRDMLKSGNLPTIKKIIMAGAGNVRKFKYILPCFNCTHRLKPYVTDDTEIQLLPLAGSKQDFRINFKELTDSYRTLKPSSIKGEDLAEIRQEIKAKTVLNDLDGDFVSELTLLGKNRAVNFYLTGSSSGRGAVSDLIRVKTGRPYRDIDIIAVVDHSFEQIEKEVEFLLKKYYHTVVKEVRPLLSHQSKPGVIYAKTFYYCGSDKRLVEFAWARIFKDSFSYPAYQENNWFHRLS